MTTLVSQLIGHFDPLQAAIWSVYMPAAVMLPVNHVRPILKYLLGNNGIGESSHSETGEQQHNAQRHATAV